MKTISETYTNAIKHLKERLAKIKAVQSAVLFGSVARCDEVPGWSDIDVLLFVHNRLHCATLYQHLSGCVIDVRSQYGLDLNFDTVLLDQFMRDGHVPGRPRYFSFEVARYGKTITGEPVLPLRTPTHVERNLMVQERRQLVDSHLLRWRRSLASDSKISLPSHENLARLIKTYLHLLKYETGPILEPPITNLAALAIIADRNPRSPLISGFSLAIQLRASWSRDNSDNDKIDVSQTILTNYLLEYKPLA